MPALPDADAFRAVRRPFHRTAGGRPGEGCRGCRAAWSRQQSREAQQVGEPRPVWRAGSPSQPAGHLEIWYLVLLLSIASSYIRFAIWIYTWGLGSRQLQPGVGGAGAAPPKLLILLVEVLGFEPR